MDFNTNQGGAGQACATSMNTQETIPQLHNTLQVDLTPKSLWKVIH